MKLSLRKRLSEDVKKILQQWVDEGDNDVPQIERDGHKRPPRYGWSAKKELEYYRAKVKLLEDEILRLKGILHFQPTL